MLPILCALCILQKVLLRPLPTQAHPFGLHLLIRRKFSPFGTLSRFLFKRCSLPLCCARTRRASSYRRTTIHAIGSLGSLGLALSVLKCRHECSGHAQRLSATWQTQGDPRNKLSNSI